MPNDASPTRTRRVRLKHRPQGLLSADDFTVDETVLPSPVAGEVLTRTLYLSLDPYLLRLMRAWEGAEPEWREGIVIARTIGEVVRSSVPQFAPGDRVLGYGRWQDFDLRPASALRKLPARNVPLSAHLGAVGHSGFTAWGGISLATPQAGETFVVSAAAGAVGGVAGQMARMSGARVVGIAGGAEKCRYVVEDLRFDACVDYKAADFEKALAKATPDGVDSYFENVGGAVLDNLLARMKLKGRIYLCGLIAHYSDDKPVALKNFREFLQKTIALHPFRVADFADQWDKAESDLIGWAESGVLRFRETVANGLESAPEAYLAMLSGDGIGKHVVKLG